ncbi:phosphoglycerate kinase [Raphidocelis subcapitata]|uniref:Phosphoglycerate kinase n=1 Tax=Raphidocelis subcapitata TaxID=307507 RepID=A0A2V0PNP7_9CHLO|nr:phosphoglycerate kinase [Raphidocelis subcapitata]|eukprot:GBF99580.1 phosphoglycerate kinase [Raphidocelis subcapitata]
MPAAANDLPALAARLVAAAEGLARAEDLRGVRVLLRADLNVPLTPDGAVADDSRIRATLPALQMLAAKGARVALASHLGRPDADADAGGRPAAWRARHSLAPVAAELRAHLPGDSFAGLAPDCVGPAAAAAVGALKDGQVLLLENLRLHAGEAANDAAFAAQLAALADVYVGDAFGVMHRAQASVTAVPALMPHRYPGPLVARELSNYLATMVHPRRPLGVAMGGAKVKDKIGVLRELIARADVLVVGGRMAYTFLAALGVSVGRTQIEQEWLEPARKMVDAAKARGVKLLLPTDVLVSESLDAPVATRIVPLTRSCCTPEAPCIPPGSFGVDIGPATAAAYAEALEACETLFWNGPMGRFEVPEFGGGTNALIAAVTAATKRGAATCIGGGDSLAAFAHAGPGAAVGFASTGGGASLELLEGAAMPGLRALDSPAAPAALVAAAPAPAAAAAAQ